MPPHPPFEVRPGEPGIRVFRLLDSDTAGAGAFLSDEQDGRVQNLPRTQSIAMHRGFSVRATLAQAVKLARALQREYVAEIELSWERGDSIARTLRTPGHHTVWLDPARVVLREIHHVND